MLAGSASAGDLIVVTNLAGIILTARVYDDTTVESLLPLVADKLSWPISHVQLVIGHTVVRRRHRIADRTRTLLKDFASANAEYPVVQAIKRPYPEFFPSGLCICDFGGCCCECTVPGFYVCKGCGNNGCCRCGNCGHICCEKQLTGFEERCRMVGCIPDWAVPDWAE